VPGGETSLREVTRGLSEVARLSARPDDVDALLRRALDALAEAVP
jgi:predicted RNA-binding Zn ribbon-like protein